MKMSSIYVAAAAAISIGGAVLVGTASQDGGAIEDAPEAQVHAAAQGDGDNPQDNAPSEKAVAQRAMMDHYQQHYGGAGRGLLVLDDQQTIWTYFELEDAPRPTYRILAMTFEDDVLLTKDGAVARHFPMEGRIVVSGDESKQQLHVKVPGTRVSFVAALEGRVATESPSIVAVDAKSFGSATLTQRGLERVLRDHLGLTGEVVGSEWPIVLHAGQVYAGGLGSEGQTRAQGCCEQGITCLSGGEGSSTCQVSRGGQSVSITCDPGYYACCCNIGGPGTVDLRASCCEDPYP